MPATDLILLLRPGLVLTGTLGIAGKQVKSTIGGIIGSTEFFYEVRHDYYRGAWLSSSAFFYDLTSDCVSVVKGWRGNGILGLARADCRALRFP